MRAQALLGGTEVRSRLARACEEEPSVSEGSPRGYDGTASHGAYRPSRAAAPTAGGSACRLPRPPCRAPRRSGRTNRPSARSRRDRADRHVSRHRCCRAARASEGSSTEVCPDVTTCRGPRTEPAGLTGTTWPVTSQSNRWRIAARRCLRLNAASSRVPASIRVATCTGWTAPIDGTPALAHQAKNSSATRA
jgi:hypothetical protein